MTDLRRIATNLATGTGGTVLSTAVGVLVFSLSARHLGPSDFGHYQTVMAMLAVIGVTANLGTQLITLREISSPDGGCAAALGTGIALRGMATLLVLLGGVGVSALLDVDQVIVHGALLGLVGWTAMQMNQVVLTVFQSRLKQHLAVMADLAGMLATLALVITFIALGGRTMAMIGAMAAGHLFSLALAWVFARREMPFSLSFDARRAVAMIRHGWPVGASAVVMVVTMRLDILLLGGSGPSAEVGEYGVALKVFQLSLVIPTLLGGFMVKSLMNAEGGTPERIALIGNGVSTALFGGVLLALFLWFAAQPLIVLIGGAQFVSGTRPLQLLGVAALFACPAALLRVVAATVDRQLMLLKADLLGLAAGASAYVVLIPQWGATGAATGKIIAFAVGASLSTWWVLGDSLPRTVIASVRRTLAGAR